MLKLRYWQLTVLTACMAVSVGVFHRNNQITEGQKAFERLGCQTCHLAGGAPSLGHVARKYDRKTFVDFVTDPETIYDRERRKPLNSGYPPMPRLEASHRDIEVLSYFLSAQH